MYTIKIYFLYNFLKYFNVVDSTEYYTFSKSKEFKSIDVHFAYTLVKTILIMLSIHKVPIIKNFDFLN